MIGATFPPGASGCRHSSTLTAPFLQAAAVVVIVALLWFLPEETPALVAALILAPLMLVAVTLVVDAAGLAEMGRTYGIKIRLRDWLRLVLGAVPYLLVLTVAALRALVREVRGARGWEQTASHRRPSHRAPAWPHRPSPPSARARLPVPAPAGGSKALTGGAGDLPVGGCPPAQGR